MLFRSRVNKGRASPDTRLVADDAVRLPPVRVSARAVDKAQAIVPERDFAVMLEDAHLIAVNKPAGLAVHGGSGVSFGVIEQIRQSMPHASEFELVHRLDRETSGILDHEPCEKVEVQSPVQTYVARHDRRVRDDPIVPLICQKFPGA